jgi:hypothetical protein
MEYKIKCNQCSISAVNGLACHESGCPNPVTIYSAKGKDYAKFNWVEYDVWGNRRDGFEVNDAWTTSVHVLIPADLTDTQVLRALKQAGVILKGKQSRSFEISGDDTTIYLTHAKSGYPLGELRRE